ncbi:hypothetical protein PROSTU_01369 [Providencia stuartii ATCC 25827]|uniref:Uncharacterized protein n=1 Tax=Providencia stuartii ATCC 25827 TaxID=471874 RepID=A0AA86YN01_PROST|nr:hypothetical protein PROSTU_01369 [Providencia stuartii ATCC 25827]
MVDGIANSTNQFDRFAFRTTHQFIATFKIFSKNIAIFNNFQE